MSRDEKLVGRIKARPPEADFDDVKRVLELHGWRQSRQSGSHAAFRAGKGRGTIIVPIVGGRKVKRAYLDMIIEKLEL